MNGIWIFGSCGIFSYLLGSVPSGFLVARARGVDIRAVGSGNIGATNVYRCIGKGAGIFTFACDILKGLAPVALLPLAAVHGAGLSPARSVAVGILCAAAAVAGHNWPVFLKFKGGKGVATSAGALLGLAPAAMGIGLCAWLLTFLLTRYVSVASIAAALAVSAAAWVLRADNDFLLPAALTLLAALVVWRHKPNLQRLAKGTENRFEFGRKKPST